VWTTTPWTLPANLAVAVGEHVDYYVVEASGAAAQGGHSHSIPAGRWVVADQCVEALAAVLQRPLRRVCDPLPGSALAAAGLHVAHPLSPDRVVPVIAAAHVTVRALCCCMLCYTHGLFPLGCERLPTACTQGELRWDPSLWSGSCHAPRP
jgi:isoleucyl-tRNA synthetase